MIPFNQFLLGKEIILVIELTSMLIMWIAVVVMVVVMMGVVRVSLTSVAVRVNGGGGDAAVNGRAGAVGGDSLQLETNPF